MWLLFDYPMFCSSTASMPRDPRKRQDPRSFGKSGDKSTPPIIPIESQDTPFEAPPPVFITSSEGDVVWNVIPVTVERSPKTVKESLLHK